MKISTKSQIVLKRGQKKAKPVFFEENVRNSVWICRDPISLILGIRFSLILGTR